MNIRAKFWGLLVVLIIVELIVFAATGIWGWELLQTPEKRILLVLILGGCLFASTLALTIICVFIDVSLLRALSAVEKGTAIIAHTNPAYSLELPTHHSLGKLPQTIQMLARKLEEAKHEVALALRTGALREQEQKVRLETILRELSEGVIVCDNQARILLYNLAALGTLGQNQQLGLGRSIYKFLAAAPIEHALQILRHRFREQDRVDNNAEFICTTLGAETLLRCRLSLLSIQDPKQSTLDTGFVLTLQDVTAEIVAVRRRDDLLRSLLEDLRGPLANLRAAAETLTSYPDMNAKDRRSFEGVVAEESKALSARLNTLANDSRSLVGGEWVMADIFSADLITSVKKQLLLTHGPRLTMTGMPLWLRVDSHTLTTLIEYLVLQIQEYAEVREIDIESLMGDRRVYIDLVWQGTAIPSAMLTAWQNTVLQAAVGAPTAHEVLKHHGSEIWSQAHRRPGYALLRIPLPSSPMQWEGKRQRVANRPEFYDFELDRTPAHPVSLLDRSLTDCDYVVFDTETTGLNPSEGDEIISIGAVRIVNQRLLSGETFTRMVNPRRSIPKSATRIHNISDTQVKDSPPIQVVLPQFKDFVGDAVLVAHNAAFDMKFIKLKESESGLRFTNPVLDVLLLSVYVHDHTQDHNLESIAERFGIEVNDRHSALGDAMVTAQILLGLLDLLDEEGIRTLGEAIEASMKMVEVRKQQQVF